MQNEKKYFASANTEKGFVSYFDEIYGGLDMVYVIKGGPGTGKSTLMRRVADEAERQGYNVEYFYCSSDPLSLDGIIIEEKRSAVIDGTAPHTYDPKYPGIKDKIIHLGENWNSDLLKKSAREICRLTDEKNAVYSNLYNYLSAAGRIESEIRLYNRRAVLFEKMQGAADRLTRLWKSGGGFRKRIRPIDGICHAGSITYQTYHALAESNYVIRDRYGIGGIFMEMILKKAESKGLSAVYSPSAVSPNEVKALLIPEAGCSFMIGDDDGVSLRQINMDRFVDDLLIKENKQKNRFAKRCLNSLYEGVQRCFDEIYDLHVELESHYVGAMDFGKNALVTERIKKELFG